MKFYKNTTLLVILILLLANPNTLFAQSKSEENKIDTDGFEGFWNLFLKSFDIDGRDTKSKYTRNKGLNRKLNLEGIWQFAIGDNDQWKSRDYNDKSWEQINVPSEWENEGFNGYDGYAWYRIHFDGKLLVKNDVHFIVLGAIDDVDETYLNGKLIGKSGAFPPRFRTAYAAYREYIVNNEVINFDGDNVIAVRVYDDYKIGGLVNGSLGIYTSKNSENILQSLHGAWKFSTHNKKTSIDNNYDDQDWETLFVPSYWDNQGYRSLDGIGWYRKKFELDFELDYNQNYFLVLGKIDDFDITFLNGEKIGETNDGLKYGISKSYDEIRLYKMPNKLLKEDGENVIAIKVTDIGVDGGVYNGPIGIVKEEDITRVLKSNSNGYD
jgi:hypothetical protein